MSSAEYKRFQRRRRGLQTKGVKATTFRNSIRKECTICHVVKDRSEFNPRPIKRPNPDSAYCRDIHTMPDTHSPFCIACQTDYQRKYMQNRRALNVKEAPHA